MWMCRQEATLVWRVCDFGFWTNFCCYFTELLQWLRTYRRSLYRNLLSFMFLWPCIVSKAWRKNTNKMQQYRWFIFNCRCWLLTTVSTCFGHLYAHHQEKRPRVTAYGVYLLVVLDVAGCGTLVLRWGCEHWVEQQPSQLSHPQRSTTVPQPATSNTTSKYTPYAVTRGPFSWRWAWRCPKHVETVVNNQHLQLTINHVYCCILLVFFLHAGTF